jgi:proteasome lid subunit RPN8/RPN11
MFGKKDDSSPLSGKRFRVAVLEEMLSAAEKAYPREWVGALLGDRGVLEKVVTMRNEADDPFREYSSRPEFLLHVAILYPEFKLIGVSHSHPDGDSQLSAADLAHAIPGLLYFVIPVVAGRADRIGVWEIPLASSDGMQV